jgi:hypothetical protein
LDAPAIGSLHLASRADALPGLDKARTDSKVSDWIVRVLLPRDVRIAERNGVALGFIALHAVWIDQR